MWRLSPTEIVLEVRLLVAQWQSNWPTSEKLGFSSRILSLIFKHYFLDENDYVKRPTKSILFFSAFE